jgi:hypothetical protein
VASEVPLDPPAEISPPVAPRHDESLERFRHGTHCRSAIPGEDGVHP